MHSIYYLHVLPLCQIKCNRTSALYSLFDMILESTNQKIAVIESGCSKATQAITEITHYYNITHVSLIASKVVPMNHVLGDFAN